MVVVLCVKEIAARLGCSKRSVSRLFDSGDLEGWRLGKRPWRTTELHLESYIQKSIAAERQRHALQNISDRSGNLSPKMALFGLPRQRETA